MTHTTHATPAKTGPSVKRRALRPWFVAAAALPGVLFPTWAAAQFVPVDFSAHFTSRIQDRAGCAYTYPAGPQVFGGVPFSIPATGPNAWDALGAPANTLDMAVNIPSAIRVYTLINTAWGLPGPASYASVEFFGDAGAYFRKDLVGDVDIRDYLQNTYTNTINNTTTTNAYYSTDCPQQWVRLDRQEYDLTATFRGQHLNRILFTDTGASGYQLMIVEGITVETSCYANCDGSTTAPVLNVGDFTCFLQKYAAGDPYANCDTSTVPPTLNVADFTCFLQKYAAGCQ